VPDIDEAKARALLADFEQESSKAAVRQAADLQPADDEDDHPASPPPARSKWVVWVAMAAVLLFAVPLALNILMVAWHFVTGLFD
jgi:hypothetical protein